MELLARCGQELDAWQVLLTCITLATIAGRLAASEVGGLVARQNGKGGWLEAIAIWSLFEVYLYGERDGLTGRKNTTLWTAHELKTSDEAYGRVKSLIEANPDLAAEVVTWNGGLTGTHIIELRDGSRLIFLARSKSSGRGFSPRRIIFDEAQELSALAFRAMMYATSAQGNRRQLIFAGTVPSEENDAAIWTAVRDRGREGKPGGRLAWAEWTPEGSDDPATPPDPESWKARAEANPALGTRILVETIDDEWEAANADLDGFLRERLSVWPSQKSGSTTLPNWFQLSEDTPTEPRALALGISTDPDQEWISLGAALAGERPHLALNDRRPSTERVEFAAHVADVQKRHGCPVAIHAKNFLIPDLEDAGVVLTPMGLDEFAQSAADLATDVKNAAVGHGDYPEVNTAVSASKWRMLDGRRVFDGRKSDISALESVQLALALSKTTVEFFGAWR